MHYSSSAVAHGPQRVVENHYQHSELLPMGCIPWYRLDSSTSKFTCLVCKYYHTNAVFRTKVMFSDNIFMPLNSEIIHSFMQSAGMQLFHQ